MPPEQSTVENPYEAPRAAVQEATPDARAFVFAGKWRRFFNWLIDRAVIYLLAVVLGVALIFFGGEPWVERIEALGFWQEVLLEMVLMLCYYVPMEGLYGLSVGKLITRTRVVNEHGHAPTLRQAFLRTLCRFIPFDALSVAFSEDGRTRGWHDSIPRTYVVRK